MDYLVYGSADPIFQDLKKKKTLNFLFKFFFKLIFFFFTHFLLSVPITDRGGGQINNYGVQGTQELEPTDKAGEETRLIVLSHNGGSRAEA